MFADGRVEGEKPVQGPTPQARVPATRIEKLSADLAATGVLALQNGCWTPRSPVPDGFGGSIATRDKSGAVHAYEWSTDVSAPEALERAMKIGGSFAAEVEPLLVAGAGAPRDAGAPPDTAAP